MNLLDNAIKYSAPGQSVDVRVALDGGRVVVAVQDHGVGIPTRDLQRIFERFYRVDVEASRQYRGTGLGLAIAKHILARHNARLTIASRLGEGADFLVTFPQAGPQPAAGTLDSPNKEEPLRLS